ncbi:hypothetical protein KI387_010075 [Taxus chinensis]|uniref:Uncharacterized protein n=1 Tax=Taxus chinensis TaxID=29808 RepID=A0AA38FKQ7_TAXCH|nr:hypothetical protein KI387_010075 [Taxus chinensis]
MDLGAPLFRRISPPSDYGQIKWNSASSNIADPQSHGPNNNPLGWQQYQSSTVDGVSVSHNNNSSNRATAPSPASTVTSRTGSGCILSPESHGQPFCTYSGFPLSHTAGSNMDRAGANSWGKWGAVVQQGEVGGLGYDGTARQLSSSLNGVPVQAMDEATAAVWADGLIKDLMQCSPNASIAQIIHNIQEVVYPSNPHVASVLEYRLRSLGDLGFQGGAQNLSINASDAAARGLKRSLDHDRRDHANAQIMVDWKSIGNPDAASRRPGASDHGVQDGESGDLGLRMHSSARDSHDLHHHPAQPDAGLKLYLNSSSSGNCFNENPWNSSSEALMVNTNNGSSSMWMQRPADHNSQSPVLSLQQQQQHHEDSLKLAAGNNNKNSNNHNNFVTTEAPKVNDAAPNQDQSRGALTCQQAAEISPKDEEEGLHILALLLRCAEAVSADNFKEANAILPQITELSTPYGTSVQRVAAYFAEAMSASSLLCGIQIMFISVAPQMVPCSRPKGNQSRHHAPLGGISKHSRLNDMDLGSRKDTVLCGVFDGHGPFGHLVAKSVSDSLPSKLCSQWEMEVKDDDSLKEVNSMVGSMNNPEDSTMDDG